jgi:hypothetical protein
MDKKKSGFLETRFLENTIRESTQSHSWHSRDSQINTYALINQLPSGLPFKPRHTRSGVSGI